MTIDRIAMLENELERLLQWVRASESRIPFVVSISTAMIGALALSISGKVSIFSLKAAIIFLPFFFLVFSIGLSILAAIPKTKALTDSQIYFGSICNLDLESYKDRARLTSENDYFDDLLNQCHRNAQIAESKYLRIRWSMICLLIAIVLWTVSLLYVQVGIA